MPATTKTKRTARATGKGAAAGSNKKRPGRKAGGGTAPADPRIIANTVFALTLKAKGGAEVFYKSNARFDNEDESKPSRIYDDLLASLNNALRLLGKEPMYDVKPLLGIGVATDTLLRRFEKEVKPFGFDYNIDHKEETGFHFTIFKEIDAYACLNVFEIKRTVLSLARRNQPLHDLFIIFLKSLQETCDLYFWFDDEYPLDSLEQYIDERGEIDDDPDADEDINRISSCVDDYKNGDPAKYKKLILKSKGMAPDDILQQLAKIKSRHPAVNVIKEGCKLLASGYKMNDFCYESISYDEYNGGIGLRFYNQSVIAWVVGDDYFHEHEQFVDCDAQEGVLMPTISFQISPKTKKLNFDWLRNGEGWPLQMSEYFDYVNKKLS